MKIFSAFSATNIHSFSLCSFFFFPSSTLLLSFLRLLLSTIPYFLPPSPSSFLFIIFFSSVLSLFLFENFRISILFLFLYFFFPLLLSREDTQDWRTVHCQGSFLQPLSLFLNRLSQTWPLLSQISFNLRDSFFSSTRNLPFNPLSSHSTRIIDASSIHLSLTDI